MDAVPGWGDVIGFLTGTGGVIAGLIYLFRQGQKGEWLYKSVHDFIVNQLNQRIAEKDAIIGQQAAAILAERERGDKWQQLYINSRTIVDQSIAVTASSINSSTPTGGG